MVLSRLDWAVVLAIAAGLLWIEHQNRITIATPAAAEMVPPAASVCPKSDIAPYSAACLAFFEGAQASGLITPAHAAWNAPAAPAASTAAQRRADARTPPCPLSNENAPYSAKCIKFLSGWFWHPYPTEQTP
jgi:hypothetical protein